MTSTRMITFEIPPIFQTPLVKNNTQDVIPSTDDLHALYAELTSRRQLFEGLEKKARSDIKLGEESMRRMREKDKGKSKATAQIKREHEPTPLPEPSARSSSQRASPFPSADGRTSSDTRLTEELRKKKKRKRDDEMETESDLGRNTTPQPSSSSNSHLAPPPLKFPKPMPSTSKDSMVDFRIPEDSLPLPSRPAALPRPTSLPNHPTKVTEDFSKNKPPPQTLVTTFYTSIEPWIRNIREEDIGFLEHTSDEVEPYVMPRLGKHYSLVWEDQDNGVFAEEPEFTDPAPLEPEWDPSTIDDVLDENRGHGPLTERVISALMPNGSLPYRGVKAAEDKMEGRPGGSGAAASKKGKINVGELETRIRDTLRYHGLLHDIPDYSERVDDPIASGLRHLQDELRKVVATNKVRKSRLAAIAKDRLAYQEYVEVRDSVDRNLLNTFSKLQKRDLPKPPKKKAKVDASEEILGNPLGPCPAALGLGPDEDHKLVVTDQMKDLVQTRRKWCDVVGGELREMQEKHPGRLWGFPTETIYEGVSEEVDMILQGQPAAQRSQRNGNGNGKGKERAMDVG